MLCSELTFHGILSYLYNNSNSAMSDKNCWMILDYLIFTSVQGAQNNLKLVQMKPILPCHSEFGQ